MKIPLEDPIWCRLYSAYGLRDVANNLKTLAQRWNDALAKDLFWEALHHQETLYPATYAALPWLWDIAQSQESARREVLLFASWVIYSATFPDVEYHPRKPGERYRGLSLYADQHAENHLPKDKWLTSADMGQLAALEQWFSETAPQMAQAAFDAIEGDEDDAAPYLLHGICVLKGSHAAGSFPEMLNSGESFEWLREELSFDETDLRVLAWLADQLEGRHGPLRKFIHEFLGDEPSGPIRDPRQLGLDL